ncbi:hypothetical protein BDP55DRAFT_414325 [Colletotrichum godetiae]|uniref:Uncharacterized protein n=1 Tax=Colletotrichum godetiae TaxID=1209918 RepID=A0AAJ0A8H3_9PEZI|nr:uncharacterized protein BDP55DRAFT_414325 [Colletotrichum godetiae]KAK1657974.1 hypothetical protein BDP55DRAFT_414325 [Colletotrichum godetiae]
MADQLFYVGLLWLPALHPLGRTCNPSSLRGSWKGDDPAGLAARNRVEGSFGEMGLAEAPCFTARFPGSADSFCKRLSSEAYKWN